MTEFSPERQLIAGTIYVSPLYKVTGEPTGRYKHTSDESFNGVHLFKRLRKNDGKYQITLGDITKALEDVNFLQKSATSLLVDKSKVKEELERLKKFVGQYGDGKTLTSDQFKEAYHAWDGSFHEDLGWNNNPLRDTTGVVNKAIYGQL